MLSKLVERAKSALPAEAPITEKQLKEVAEGITDTRRPVIAGLSILGAGLLAFVLWAFLAPLDEGVPAAGTIAVESKRKIVQHLTGGIIKKILVKESQQVNAGDPLILLDDTTSKANFDAARQQYYTLQAQTDRLHAEAIRAGTITFSQSLLDAADDPVAVENMSSQQQLFLTRRAALQGELTILAASARSAEEQIHGIEAQVRGKKEQLKFVREQLEGSRELAKEGYLPRNRWFEEERLAADLQASTSELQSSVIRATNMALEAKQRLAQRQRDFQKEVETQFSDYRREAMVAAERFRSTREDFARSVVRAPVDGFVNGLSAFTEGSVITPAARLMDIVPKDEALILEVKIDPNVIDRVHAGLPVDINMHAFANDPSLVLAGVLESVSVDLIFENNPNIPPHYLGRVRVTPEGLKRLGTRVLQPGMPAQIMIKTGERTLVQYLLKPLIMRLSASMKEH
jgi:protease secretion system membrane fusion protein